MKPSVFLSHSCKDLARADVAGADTGRADRLGFARLVRDRIAGNDRLERLDIWLDRDRLEPGEMWRAKLHRQLAICSGAVIFLNRESLESDWVRKEATILAWRKCRSPSPELLSRRPISRFGQQAAGTLNRDAPLGRHP